MVQHDVSCGKQRLACDQLVKVDLPRARGSSTVIDRTRPLIRLLLNQIGRRLTERMEFGDKPGYRHRLLVPLDELPSLGNPLHITREYILVGNRYAGRR